MEPITGLFILGLFKATETIWGKAFDAAWDPVDESPKERFARLAGTDQATQRQEAFAQAAGAGAASRIWSPNPALNLGPHAGICAGAVG